MISRNVVSQGLLLACFLLLVCGASVVEAKTAHLTVKKHGDHQLLHVRYVPVDSHTVEAYVPAGPLADSLRYYNLCHPSFQPMGACDLFEPTWHRWLQYHWFGGRWPGGFWGFDTW